MCEIYILVEARRRDYSRKILGVSLLGRMLGELAGLGRTSVNVVCEVDRHAVERLVAQEAPSSIEVAFIDCPAGAAFEAALSAAARSGCNVVCIAADLLVTRDFLDALVSAPVGVAPLAFRRPDVAVKLSAATARLIVARGPVPLAGNLTDIEVVQPGGFCQRISSRRQLVQARRMLLDRLRKPVEIEGLVCFYLMRPATLKIVGPLTRTRLLPNHVTIFSLLLGLAGAALVALGDNLPAVIGAGLYFAACFSDCLDGEIARLKYKHSYLGAWLDTLSDDIQTFFFAGAMGVYLARRPGGDVYLVLALVSMVIFALCQAYIYHQLHTLAHSGDLMDFEFAWNRKSGGGSGTGLLTALKYAVKRDFFTTLFFVLFLVGAVWLAQLLFFVSCVGFGSALVYHVYLKNRERWGAGRPLAKAVGENELVDGSRA